MPLPRLVTVLCLVMLSSCTGGDTDRVPLEDGGAQGASQALADSLSDLELDSVLVDDPRADRQLRKITDLLDGADLTVLLDGVDQTNESAAARLQWIWDWPRGLEGTEPASWRYETVAELLKVSGSWQVQWSPSVVEPTLQAKEILSVEFPRAARGEVLGGDGGALVRARPVVRYGVDRAQVDKKGAAASARGLARILDLDAAALASRVEAAGEQAFVEALVVRRAEDPRPDLSDLPGARALETTAMLAPTKTFAAALLGRVGQATASIVEQSSGVVRAGDEAGLSGLQARYDQQLRGRPGVRVSAAGRGDARTLFEVAPTPGVPLKLTLTAQAQRSAESALGALPRNSAAALVAVRPSDGAVIAMANSAGTNGQNLASEGRYAPGSTFKVASALALLREGVGPSARLDCPPKVVIDGREFSNYRDYPASGLGQITLRQAVANSCNTAFLGASGSIEPQELRSAAAALGMGEDRDVGFAAFFGQIPEPQGATGRAADLIGQGTVLASPLVMASMAASVVAGRAVLPYLVDGFSTRALEPIDPLTGSEARDLRSLLDGVVRDGTGQDLADVAGVTGAKTGTAEFGAPSSDGSLPTHAWMIATRDDLGVAVFVERGESGSGTAGPILEQFLRSTR